MYVSKSTNKITTEARILLLCIGASNLLYFHLSWSNTAIRDKGICILSEVYSISNSDIFGYAYCSLSIHYSYLTNIKPMIYTCLFYDQDGHISRHHHIRTFWNVTKPSNTGRILLCNSVLKGHRKHSPPSQFPAFWSVKFTIFPRSTESVIRIQCCHVAVTSPATVVIKLGSVLTLIVLMCRIEWAHNNATK